MLLRAKCQTAIPGNAKFLPVMPAFMFLMRLVVKNKRIHFTAVGGAGVQGNDAWALVGAEIRVGAERRALVLKLCVALRAIPVPAEDRFLFQAGLRRVHPIDPACPTPLQRRSLPPVGAIAAARFFRGV